MCYIEQKLVKDTRKNKRNRNLEFKRKERERVLAKRSMKASV